jgi:hypothetical protein
LALVVIVSRRHPGILRRIYPPLKVFTWVLIFGLGWGLLYSVRANQTRYVFLMTSFLSGMNLVRTWIARRVDPDSFKKYEGWWPTPKDSSESGFTKNL